MKYIYRSKTNKKIAGVCAGFAEYFDLDPSLVRIVWLSSILFGGTGIFIYLIAWLIIPQNPQEVQSKSIPFKRSSKNKIIAGICGGLGEYFQIDPVIFRLLFIVLTLGVGFGVLAYIILWICIPKES